MKLINLFLLSLILGALATHGQIRIGGSDLLTPELETAISRYAEARDIEVSIDLSGSYRGMEDLRSGQLDLAFLAIPDGRANAMEGIRLMPIAFKSIAVVVSPANPINQLTYPELGGIFGQSEAANITRWGQLGLTGEWSGRSIALVALGPTQPNLALDMFRHTVLRSPTLRRTIAYVDSTERLIQQLAQDTTTIGLLPTVPALQDGLKLLSLSNAEMGVAHQPTPENIASGDYPLRLPIYLAFSEIRAREIVDILRFVVSDEAAEAIRNSGLVPLPAGQRQRMAFEIERL